MTIRPTLKKLFLISSLALWGAICLAFVSQLQIEHTLAFKPQPSLAVSPNNGRWSLTHIIGTHCKCSQQIGQYLSKRSVQPDLNESVLVIGEDVGLIEKLRSSGFSVEQKTGEQLQQAGFEIGVPFVIITDSMGQVRYSGGYGDHKIIQGSAIHDLDILKSLQQGSTTSQYPILGCATNRQTQNRIDPFQLKYQQNQEKTQ